jgi:tripartite-type tricarboxylate transporter receptor subunit TctC
MIFSYRCETMRRRHVLQILPLAIAGLHLAPVRGAGVRGTFPEPGKPIRLVVPFPAGGTSDLRARQVAEHLRQDAGWTVVVDNRPGASGMIGSDLVAKAPADGYTLLLGTIGTLAINPACSRRSPTTCCRISSR